eukprot:Sdes_comp21819_c0_seq1m20377
MAERKVLNKYIPPNFDHTKIPRLRGGKSKQISVRLMAPFNMRCSGCKEYIYKSTKFNARKETVEGEEYLGIKVFRFYIRCGHCATEITFKTDPKNSDYVAERNCTRNFDFFNNYNPLTAVRELDQIAQEMETLSGRSDAMRQLENRTAESKKEMEIMDALEEIRDLNARSAAIKPDDILERIEEEKKKELKKQLEEEEAEISLLFRKRPVQEDDDNDATGTKPARKVAREKIKPPIKSPPSDPPPSQDSSLGVVHFQDISVGVLKPSSCSSQHIKSLISTRSCASEPKRAERQEAPTASSTSLVGLSQYASSSEDEPE